MSLPVYLRLRKDDEQPSSRPSSATDKPYLEIASDDPSTIITNPPEKSRTRTKEKFAFSEVFDGSTQEEVYKKVMLPMVKNVVTGSGDGLLFAMGTTGSGKTHTLLGNPRLGRPGMVHYALKSVFDAIGDRLCLFDEAEAVAEKSAGPNRESHVLEAIPFIDNGILTQSQHQLNQFIENAVVAENADLYSSVGQRSSHGVYISMVEIYNDRVFDLLDKRRPVVVKCDTKGKFGIPSQTKLFCATIQEAFQVLEQAHALRSTHSTESNSVSSRSHALFTVTVKRLGRTMLTTSLTIGDLAGSERNKSTRAEGERLSEACSINQSLMMLGQCLQRQREVKGYKLDRSILRSSKLAQLLLPVAFSRDAMTALLITANQNADFSSTIQIMRYSALARDTIKPPVTPAYLKRAGSGPSTPAQRAVSNSSISSTGSTMSHMSSASHTSHDDTKDNLIRTIAALQEQLYQAQQREDALEIQIREEVNQEMETHMEQMRQWYLDQLDQATDAAQNFTDKKISILGRRVNSDNVSDELVKLRKENQLLKQRLNVDKENVEIAHGPDSFRSD
ncbi:P-loop containing nucleoside triphosphate hydrolase protein [Yarrowia lipolytica]|uniref:YALI0E10879p n=2 Tax=Yarrowia lipolytica TaxID=4952 RepID=Q6C6B3_YARLI|nr:YALI0E10879p [Yarrowia lipolytica CLIB122]RDW25238.1 P-loop containing nucleoside triphosphate hydrolase protein [Yarrowia lipolytica]RDW29639.1 P-loop containing nucleoside triphosphate hydrolase protein [Yarrowia lipolytica]RDW38864.1 P-loop containing nucleoside triphosphate hydrolase protein [Yarrowia lipolytica]RDW49294.1 P-loop containing nucleoside triphosphate hydrolase protein [Yarrowia lipolytica]RDW55881.1 P-loop containing nucleoside triphosphate hydrolase protein [Yarrowia lipo|eukprot:XP_503799.1 YALI0E10879p [Yarrowia lipolytica CLIB122]